MQTQNIDSSRRPCKDEPNYDDDQGRTEAAIIALLLSTDHHGLWSREELIRELSASHLEATDALAGLAGAGLIHELGFDFVAATRAAQRMDDLEL
ncbi:MAG TPA: hypothetical protein VIJ39_12490 [Solirubrobacteraceae bacterium]